MRQQAKIGLVVLGCVVGLLALGIVAWARANAGTTTGQAVNATIDNLKETGTRLTELPLILLLLGAAVVTTLLALPLMIWGTVSRRVTLARVLVSVMAGTALASLAIVADRKFNRMSAELNDMHRQMNHDRFSAMPMDDDTPASPSVAGGTTSLASANGGSTSGASAAGTPTAAPVSPTANAGDPAATKPASGKRTTLMVDKTQVTQSLAQTFGTANVYPRVHDLATDVVEVDLPNYPAIAYMAVVNLKTPGLEVKFGGSLTQKTLTSDFAKSNNCLIAINGEAGQAPEANSGLGVWRGNMISAGTVLLREDPSNRRPFFSFDKDNNVTFTAMAAKSRAVPDKAYNVIWGRLDAIIDGKVQTEAERDRQPRTAMGISKDGSKLFLMVVDGRQQRYSIGFTRAEVGAFMQAFGADNGMLCDEGGSSCIYMKNLKGIVNRPSDGEERATYTHFGISLKAS